MLSTNLHQDCLSNGQTKQNLTVQHQQLCKQVQAVQTSLLSSPFSSMAVEHGPSLLILKKRIKAFKTKCLRKLLHNSYLERKTNGWVQSEINFLVGPQEPLLATVKRIKLTCMVRAYHTPQHPIRNHPSRHPGGWVMPWLAEECWMDNIKEWTSLPMPELLTRASCKKVRKRISAELSPMSLWQLNWSRKLIELMGELCLFSIKCCPCEKLWNWQRCLLFDAVYPAFPLPTIDHWVAHPPSCPEGWFCRGCRDMWHTGYPNHASFRLFLITSFLKT